MRLIWVIVMLFPLFTWGAEYPASIIRVIDGDTVILNWNNQEKRVRIIGIDTPEIVATNRPAECFGQEASNYAKQLLPISSIVILTFEEEYDKYNRAMGYITLSDGRDFGQIMIQNGYA